MKKNILVVVDVQNDFCKGGTLEVPNAESLIEPLNETIKKADNFDYEIIYTRDWHPYNHKSFKEFGGPWPKHCVRDSFGAQFHRNLYFPNKYLVIDTGVKPEEYGYSPFENLKMIKTIEDKNINSIYVTGIALEYCVMETCLDLIKYNKSVFAIEPLIRSISIDKNIITTNWNKLIKCGIKKIERL